MKPEPIERSPSGRLRHRLDPSIRTAASRGRGAPIAGAIREVAGSAPTRDKRLRRSARLDRSKYSSKIFMAFGIPDFGYFGRISVPGMRSSIAPKAGNRSVEIAMKSSCLRSYWRLRPRKEGRILLSGLGVRSKVEFARGNFAVISAGTGAGRTPEPVTTSRSTSPELSRAALRGACHPCRSLPTMPRPVSIHVQAKGDRTPRRLQPTPRPLRSTPARTDGPQPARQCPEIHRPWAGIARLPSARVRLAIEVWDTGIGSPRSPSPGWGRLPADRRLSARNERAGAPEAIDRRGPHAAGDLDHR